MNLHKIFLLSSLGALLYASHTQAEMVDSKHPWKASSLIGLAVTPLYMGDDDTQLSLIPDFKIEYADTFFASLLNGIGYNLISTERWQAGPIIKYDFGRNEKDGNPLSLSGDDPIDLLGLGDVDGSLEAGGILAFGLSDWQTKLEVRQGLDGGHEGLVGEFEWKLTGQTSLFTKPVFYSLGPEVVWGDGSYQQAYFGITPEQSTGSRLEVYVAKSGLVSYGLHANLAVVLDNRWMVGGFVGYDKLGNQPKNSPLIEQRGSDNQGLIGVFLSYNFTE